MNIYYVFKSGIPFSRKYKKLHFEHINNMYIKKRLFAIFDKNYMYELSIHYKYDIIYRRYKSYIDAEMERNNIIYERKLWCFLNSNDYYDPEIKIIDTLKKLDTNINDIKNILSKN